MMKYKTSDSNLGSQCAAHHGIGANGCRWETTRAHPEKNNDQNKTKKEREWIPKARAGAQGLANHR